MSSSGKIVLSYHDCLLRESDLNLLNGSNWINDNLIAFWLEYLVNDRYVKIPNLQQLVTCISPQVVQLIKMSDINEIQIILSDLQLNTKDLIIFPINDCSSELLPGGGHWSLLSYSTSNGFAYFDSLTSSGNLKHANIVAQKVHSLINSPKPFKIDIKECLKQKNGYDCGMYVMMFADQRLFEFASKQNPEYSTEFSNNVLTPDNARKVVGDLIHQLARKKET